MRIGLLELDLFIPASASLKDKRMILKSIKERTRNKFNVSLAEVAFQDKWQRASIAIVTVSETDKMVQETLNKVFNFWDAEIGFEVVKYNFDYR